jgi:hypothetical protein
VWSATSIIVRGAILGALTGLSLAATYTGLLIAFFLAMTLFGAASTAPTNPGDAGMLLLIGPATAGFMFICAGFIGVLPGMVLGLAIGALISLPVALLRPRLKGWSAAVLGSIVSAGVVVLIHLFLIGSDPDPTVQEYLLLTILPGLLCIGAGGWVGWKLNRSIEP